MAYFAGIIDGEGHIGIKKSKPVGRGISPRYQERLTVAISEIHFMEMLRKEFGGMWYARKYNNKIIKSHKSGFVWEVTDKKAAITLIKVFPYLTIKRNEAELVLKLTKSKIQNRKNRGQLNKKILDYREKIYKELKTIHGNHHNILDSSP